MVPFGPLWFTSVHCGPIQSNLVHWGNFFSPDALFRPRAYKNRASGQKKIFPSGSQVLESRDIMVDFFFPQMLCLGQEPTKTEHLGEKKIDSSSYWGNFFSQMLCLGREPTKTEHLGPKNIPSGS